MTKLKVNEVQLFEKGYNTPCSTFSCYEKATKFIGRPDAPLNLSYALCEKCVNQLVESVNEQFPQKNSRTEAIETTRNETKQDNSTVESSKRTRKAANKVSDGE